MVGPAIFSGFCSTAVLSLCSLYPKKVVEYNHLVCCYGDNEVQDTSMS